MQSSPNQPTGRIPRTNPYSLPFWAPSQVVPRQHRRSDGAKRTRSDSALLARYVSTLDHQLGRHVEDVGSLLNVQALILARQECALKAIQTHGGELGAPECPRYLVTPLGSLADWPEPYAETPELWV